MLKAGGARLEAMEVVSGWFDDGGVKLRVIGIFVMVDAVTIDKPVNRLCKCCEQYRSKSGPLWDTGVDLSYRHGRQADMDET